MRLFRFFNSFEDMKSHLKCKFAPNPPFTVGLAVTYSIVSLLMMSMMGDTMCVKFC